jgi:hypothetical protein
MSIDHAVVWLEFRTAKVFLFEDAATPSVAGEPELIGDKRLISSGRFLAFWKLGRNGL